MGNGNEEGEGGELLAAGRQHKNQSNFIKVSQHKKRTSLSRFRVLFLLLFLQDNGENREKSSRRGRGALGTAEGKFNFPKKKKEGKNGEDPGAAVVEVQRLEKMRQAATVFL